MRAHDHSQAFAKKLRHRSPPLSVRSAVCLGLSLWSYRLARAENSASYKYADYREADGRIVVRTQNALVEQDLGTDMHVKVQGVIDAIAGATPNGQPAPVGSDQVVMTQIHDRRKAWNANFSDQLSLVQLDLGIADSTESDYRSAGWSVNALTDFNQKNTTLLTGIAGTRDHVKVFYQPNWADKRTFDAIAGLTQLLDPKTSVTFNFTWGRSNGFLSDQYKLVQKSIAVAPGVFLPFTFGENRPDNRTRWIALAAVNHFYARLNGAIDASYRFYHDSFGINAHTLELKWIQHAGRAVTIQPQVRLYQQTAADFYHYNLDATSIIPVAGTPNPQGPFYSSDYRLSSLRTATYGLKIIWSPVESWQLDVTYERYAMRGRDGLTPQSAYPTAGIWTGGTTFSW